MLFFKEKVKLLYFSHKKYTNKIITDEDKLLEQIKKHGLRL